MRLYDLARVIRSKNAGPFTLTVDLLLANATDFARVLEAEHFTVEHIAAMYGVAPEQVRICPFPAIHTIKVTLPRPGSSSGAPADTDVYGSQQHFPLGGIRV